MQVVEFCKKHGLRTLRLIHGKKIPIKNSRGVHDATLVTDEGAYEGYNVGIAGGRGLAIVDFDPRSYNEKTALYLEKLHDYFPDTVSVLTPSGGFHLYYEYDESLAMPSFDLAPGIQLIAENKYALGAGCFNAELDKYYRWRKAPSPRLRRPEKGSRSLQR